MEVESSILVSITDPAEVKSLIRVLTYTCDQYTNPGSKCFLDYSVYAFALESLRKLDPENRIFN